MRMSRVYNTGNGCIIVFLEFFNMMISFEYIGKRSVLLSRWKPQLLLLVYAPELNENTSPALTMRPGRRHFNEEGLRPHT